jgi:carbonic anhydrase
MQAALRSLSSKAVLHARLIALRRLCAANDLRIASVLSELALFYRECAPGNAQKFWDEALAIYDARGVTLPARSLGMANVIDGVHRFQRGTFAVEKDLFQSLSHGQHPEVLIIACSDSRIETSHVTQMLPGELFVLRHVGNIVPCHGCDAPGASEASIEFAVTALGIKDIIVLGHSHCGAMRGLLHPETLAHLPAVEAFLSHAQETREKVEAVTVEMTDAQRLELAIKENVLVQIEHAKTHPAVANALAANKVSLHGWVYEIESGSVRYYDFAAKAWKTL